MKLKLFVRLMLTIGLFTITTSLALGNDIANENVFKNWTFSDLEMDDNNFDAIYFLYNTGVVEGYVVDGEPLREYRPKTSINRAEFLTLILQGTKKANNQEYESCFSDVPSGEWYTTFICQAKEEGWVDGYPDGSFKPASTINDVEALKILGEVLDWQLAAAKSEDEWYQPYFNFATDKEIVTSEDVGLLMNRGDIAEMIFRYTELNELAIPTYDVDYVDALFDLFKVPHDGALGPGGIFGPYGPFGQGGAFINNGPFAGGDNQFNLIGDEYFESHFCYYSDQGDFVEDILNILDGYTQDIHDSEFVEGAGIDGFGKVFCYSGIAETDLIPLTEELRNENEIVCWNNTAALAEDEYFDELLCYAPPKETIDAADDDVAVEGDDSNNNVDDSDLNNVNIDISLNKTSVTANGLVEVSILLTDNAGAPLTGRSVSVGAATGIDYFKSIYVNEVGEGIYFASFKEALAGDFRLYVKDKSSGTQNMVTVKVNPGVLDHVEIVDITYPYENDKHNVATIKVAGKDKDENTIPYSSVNNDLGAVTSLGTITSITHDDKGIFTIELTANDWGAAYVSIIDNKSASVLSNETIEILFFPVQLDMPKGISSDTTQISAPIYVYFPNKYGRLGSYEFDVYYNPAVLDFVDVEDPYPTDSFVTPEIEANEEEGVIHLSQVNNDPNSTLPEDLSVGTLLFNVVDVGSGSINVANAVLTDIDGEVKSYLQRFGETLITGGEAVGDAVGSVIDDFWIWWYNVKPSKNICIDAFIFPGSGAVAADVTTDVANANAIYAKIANSCNCDFYLNVSVHSTTLLSAAEWNAIDANGDGDLDEAEMDSPVNNHAPSAGCIGVYYTPKIDGGDLGWSWEGPPTEGIAMDHAGDDDQRTLAHELAHQISNGAIKDPANPPDSTTQGADTAGNLMNYNNTGDVLTKAQCSLIGAQLP